MQLVETVAPEMYEAQCCENTINRPLRRPVYKGEFPSSMSIPFTPSNHESLDESSHKSFLLQRHQSFMW
jgi:hypothetical protein